MRRNDARLSIFVIVGLMAFLLAAAGPTSAQEPEPTASPTSDPSPTPSGEADPSASPTPEAAESETSESETSSSDASEAEAAEAEGPPSPCETVDCSPPELACPSAAPELCDTPDLSECFSSTTDAEASGLCTPPDLSDCFTWTTSAVVAPELCPLPGVDPVDVAGLLSCLDTDPYADPPIIGTLTIVGYGGVDPNECKISSTGGLPVRVCLENFGVIVPGTCMGHKQQGSSLPAVCTPGIWQTYAWAEALGTAHSDPVVILDPMDCWTPPPAPG